MRSGLDLLHVLQLVLHSAAVATPICSAPRDDRRIAQDGGKRFISGLDELHVLQLLSHRAAVATIVFVAPCDDRTIATDGGKSQTSGLDLLCVLQLVLYTTPTCSAPCNDRPLAQYCCRPTTIAATAYLNPANVQGQAIFCLQPDCGERCISTQKASRRIQATPIANCKSSLHAVLQAFYRFMQICLQADLSATDQRHIQDERHQDKTQCSVKTLVLVMKKHSMR